jgi:hypothetical protein
MINDFIIFIYLLIYFGALMVHKRTNKQTSKPKVLLLTIPARSFSKIFCMCELHNRQLRKSPISPLLTFRVLLLWLPAIGLLSYFIPLYFWGCFSAVLLANTFLKCRKKNLEIEPLDPSVAARLRAKGPTIAKHLSEIIKLKTVSFDQPTEEQRQERNLNTIAVHEYLTSAFPRLHANLKRTVVNEFSLLYEWTGFDPSLDPYLLYAHIDVVPALDAELWGVSDPSGRLVRKIDPFDGEIYNGYVWGRGAIDDKQAIISIMAAVEDLLSTEGLCVSQSISSSI